MERPYTYSYNQMYKKYNTLLQASRSQCRADEDVGLRPLGCWECGFEYRLGYRCLSRVLSGTGRYYRPVPPPWKSCRLLLMVVFKCNNNHWHLTMSRYKEDRIRKKKESITSGLSVVLLVQLPSLLNPPSSYVHITRNELSRYPVTCKSTKAR
jgi:hypothetical protein